jgi:hypothetical protein
MLDLNCDFGAVASFSGGRFGVLVFYSLEFWMT